MRENYKHKIKGFLDISISCVLLIMHHSAAQY